jgi:flavin-dependent dehydrogenase
MSNRIERVTIVGGGTAGWLTALILNAHLNKHVTRGAIKITLIESPNVPTIGVGESTIQNIKNTLKSIGIDEAEFMLRCNASFKLGVNFIDWSRADGSASARFFHPLDNPPACGGHSPVYYYHKFGPHWLGTSYGENVMPNAAVIAAGKGPRPVSAGNYLHDINYGYHLDAALFANFMRDFAVARGIEHVRDDVLDVTLDETGTVKALQLDQSGNYPVEFVVDCTGFKSLIWGRMGAEPFISAADRLLNDRAIPLQLPHPDPKTIEPCTRAIALGAGWAWRVPLYSRVGTGYVYSSVFRTDDEAWEEFLTHLRKSGDLPVGAAEPERRVIKMRVGYTRQPWIKNCVAIGLSSGFVEPLEATAIYTIDAAAHRLVMNFPDKNCSPALAKAYNSSSTALMEEIVNFLQLFYRTSNREEPYWEAVRKETRLSDWLREMMELWRCRFPDLDDAHSHRLFDFSNYIYILYPKGYFANVFAPLEDSISVEDWQNYGRALNYEVARLVKSLPSHYELLTAIRAGTAGPKKSPWQPRQPFGNLQGGQLFTPTR